MSDLTNLENAVSAGGVCLHQPELEKMRNAIEAKDAEIARLREALVWMRENPHAHPANTVAVASAALGD